MRAARWVLLFAVAAGVACENGGASRTIGIDATGIVKGQIYFDANGSRTFDGPDAGIPFARIRLLAPGSNDTLFRILAGTDGAFRTTGVPVGIYTVVVDSASAAGDSAVVLQAAPVLIAVLPDDSVEFVGAVSYPLQTIAEARAAAVGTRVFIRAVALHARATFSDTTLHVVDGTGAMRATRVRTSVPAIVAADSVVLRGRIATRLGEKVLDDVTAFFVAATLIPTAPQLSTASAATGGTLGSLDAALVQIVDAEILDTATVLGNFQMTMDDGSGAVVVVLDRAADAGFNAPLPLGLYVVANRFDLVGILVPTGTGAWRVKPRSALDLTPR